MTECSLAIFLTDRGILNCFWRYVFYATDTLAAC